MPSLKYLITRIWLERSLHDRIFARRYRGSNRTDQVRQGSVQISGRMRILWCMISDSVVRMAKVQIYLQFSTHILEVCKRWLRSSYYRVLSKKAPIYSTIFLLWIFLRISNSQYMLFSTSGLNPLLSVTVTDTWRSVLPENTPLDECKRWMSFLNVGYKTKQIENKSVEDKWEKTRNSKYNSIDVFTCFQL